MVDDVHEQTEMHIWPPANFCDFGLEHALFETCPLDANVARFWNGHNSSYLPVLD